MMNSELKGKKLKVLWLVISFMFVSASAFALAAVGSPTRAIQDLDAKLDTYKTGNLTPADEVYNEKLKKDILHGTFDIRELCQIALAKHWNEINDKQKNDFVQLMTDLLEKRAILSKEQGKKKSKNNEVYTVSYKTEKFINPDKTRSLVKTNVYVKSEDVRVGLDYKVLKKTNDNDWKIYDVIVDNASLVDNYKYQFDSIIKKSGYQDLVNRMQKKLDSLNKKH